MRHQIPELWIATAVAATIVTTAHYAAFSTRYRIHATTILGLAYLAAMLTMIIGVIVWTAGGGQLR